MRLAKIIVIIVLFCLGTFIVSFNACDTFIASFDGEAKDRMVILYKDYYYSRIDGMIWKKEQATDSYKKLINTSLDSLIWDDTVIIGHSNSLYLVINIDSSNVSYFKERNALGRFLGQNRTQFKSIDLIPALAN